MTGQLDPRWASARRGAVRIILAVAIDFVFLAIALAGAFREARTIHELAHRVAVSQGVLTAIDHIESALLTANIRERGYIITGLPQDAASFDSAAALVMPRMAELERAAANTSIRPAELMELKAALQRTIDHYRLVIRERRQQGFAETNAVVESGFGEALLVQSRALLRDISQREAFLVDAQVDAQSDAARTLTIAVSALALLSALLFVAVLLIVQRHLSHQTRALRQAEENAAHYRLLFDANPQPMWVYDRDTLRFLAVNDAAVRQYQLSRDEFLSITLRDIRPPEDMGAFDELIRQRTEGSRTTAPLRHRRKDGSLIDVEITSDDIRWDGRSARIVVAKDVTEQRRLEDQLRQAQKMEAVGQLSAGIAHDFNNVLSAIIGYSELVIESLPAEDPRQEDLREIREAAQRAATLTRQLLAFSRKQVLVPETLDLNELLRGVAKLLRRVVGEDVKVVTVLQPELGTVLVDPGQMEQVILNLAVNSRDAMPTGGTLTIETANVTLDDQYVAQHVSVKAGDYVMLAVSDTGVGMDAAVRARIFEPFFTTKEAGKGTGLGLATVYGIVKQSGGHVWVYSEPGQGTSFKIYLPRIDAPAAAQVLADAVPAKHVDGATVLLVEDDPAVRTVAKQILERSRYNVLEAADAAAALAFAERHIGPIDLLLTDVVLPGKSGRVLAEELKALRPDIAMLYMSGYTDDSVLRHGVLEHEVAYLQKPFTAAGLAAKVAEVLSRRA